MIAHAGVVNELLRLRIEASLTKDSALARSLYAAYTSKVKTAKEAGVDLSSIARKLTTEKDKSLKNESISVEKKKWWVNPWSPADSVVINTRIGSFYNVSPDGTRLIYRDETGLKWKEIGTSASGDWLKIDEDAQVLRLSADGKYAVIYVPNRQEIYDLESGLKMHSLRSSSTEFLSGSQSVIANEPGKLGIYDLGANQYRALPLESPANFGEVFVAADGSRIGFQTKAGFTTLDLRTQATTTDSLITSIPSALSPTLDQSLILSSSAPLLHIRRSDGTQTDLQVPFERWQTRQGQFSPDGQHVAIAVGATLHIVGTQHGDIRERIQFEGHVTSVKIGADRKSLLIVNRVQNSNQLRFSVYRWHEEPK